MSSSTVSRTNRKYIMSLIHIVFKPEESRPARALAYAPTLGTENLKPHRYRHMLRGSTDGASSNRSSIDEDEKAADEVNTCSTCSSIYKPYR